MQSILAVENLSKKFSTDLKRSMVYGAHDLVKSFVFRRHPNQLTLRKGEFAALHDISFSLNQGETLGVMGANGSGKSTLLRIINGIFPPDTGRIRIHGRVGALIALGAGFHPHMTGRENIYLNGAILGMSAGHMRKNFDKIIHFADIGDFLDAPVATYSSGMTVRLGFAIAIHSIPDILVIDEVLAVGDVGFQRKCFEKILELKRLGVSTLFVSHSISSLERMCEKGLLLHHGQQKYMGPIRECVKEYMDVNGDADIRRVQGEKFEFGLREVQFSEVLVYQEDGDPKAPQVEWGKNIIIEFDYTFLKKREAGYQVRVVLRTIEGHDVQKFICQDKPFGDGVIYKNEKIVFLGTGGRFRLRILNPRLFPQSLRVDISIAGLEMDIHFGNVTNAAVFKIVEPKERRAYFEYGNMSVTEFDSEVQVSARA